MNNKNSHPPKISSLNHIAVEVNDINDALDFYLGVMGLKELPTPDSVKESGFRWIDLNNGHALHLVDNKEASPPGTAHFAIAVEDVDAWREYLSGRGVEILSPKINVYNARRFFFKDPFGNRIELVKWQD